MVFDDFDVVAEVIWGRLGVICFRFRLRGNVETVAVKTTSSQVGGRGSTIVKITPTAKMEHEATTSSIGEDQLFYCNQRGLNQEEAVSLIVNGFCKEEFLLDTDDLIKDIKSLNDTKVLENENVNLSP
mgnify:CR=1 FL=1